MSVALKHGRFQIRLKHLFLLQVVLGLPLALAVLCAQLIERGRLSSAERDRQFRALESVGFAKDDDGEIRLLSPNENCTDGNLRLLIPFAEESNYVSGARP
ncbi:MAG TPA: hypothetical protein VHC22_23525 [Pirellulales bacterium]|nr:hypothetical protein [Pirellulales bacterium]